MDAFTLAAQVRHELARTVPDPGAASPLELRPVVASTIERLGAGAVTSGMSDWLRESIDQELHAFGPIWPLVFDARISEVMVNGPRRVFVEEDGVKRVTDVHFRDEAHLRSCVDRIRALDPGHRLDASKPYADLALPDGSRVSVVLPPVAHRGPSVTIRCYQRRFAVLDDLVGVGTLDERMVAFLDGAVRARLNILFSGATATGKTTLLELLSRSVPHEERIICIEDTLELRILHPNVVRLLTRENNVEGKGAISIGDLFRVSLRMAPDRVLLGEIRGAEAFDLLQALNSGHEGSLAVLHANSPEEAIMRLENLVPLAHPSVPSSVVKRQIAHGLDLIVQMHQTAGGTRRVTRISEVRGPTEHGEPQIVDLFRWVPPTGDQRGHHEAMEVRPEFWPRLHREAPELTADILGF